MLGARRVAQQIFERKVFMASKKRTRVVVLGAAGRDFHDFNVYWGKDERFEVVAFTAAQIPNIEGRVYPPALSGKRYPKGVRIEPEERLTDLIREEKVDLVAMAYSDLSYADVMHKCAQVNAAGADFTVLGHRHTMIVANKPVIAVCAVRTGCGKSQTSRAVASILKSLGKRVAVIRHPMPYGDLSKQICQRFATLDDLDLHECTIEEREEYEPHIREGNLVFAGIDYARILKQAEKEADVILWDGGNNDTSFYQPDLYIVVTDPHRPGHELAYYPGETNLRMADVVVINKIGTAQKEDVRLVEKNIKSVNSEAHIIKARSPVSASKSGQIKGKRVLVVEDGPTLTHGEMKIGAGHIAAQKFGAAEIIDPRPYAVGSIKRTFAKYSHLTDVLPAMGYGDKQVKELEQTINKAECDLVLVGTPIDLTRILKLNKPSLRITYKLADAAVEKLRPYVESAVKRAKGSRVRA